MLIHQRDGKIQVFGDACPSASILDKLRVAPIDDFSASGAIQDSDDSGNRQAGAVVLPVDHIHQSDRARGHRPGFDSLIGNL